MRYFVIKDNSFDVDSIPTRLVESIERRSYNPVIATARGKELRKYFKSISFTGFRVYRGYDRDSEIDLSEI